MKMLDEFKAFALKGNMFDLAVALIIGAAFGKIIASLVSDIIMPPIGLLLGGVNFTDIHVTLKDAIQKPNHVTLDTALMKTARGLGISFGNDQIALEE